MRKLLVLVSVLLAGVLPGAVLSQASAAGSYKVTVKFSDRSINFGAKVTMSGKVSPNAAGSKIRIQRYESDQGFIGWRTMYTSTIRSDGTYSKKFTPSIGTFKWRAYKAAGNSRSGGASSALPIHAYTWYQMANLTYLEVLSDTTGGPGRFGGITVADAPFAKYWESNVDASGSTRWYLERQCRRFTATIGLDDARSESGAVGRLIVQGSTGVLLDEKAIGDTTKRKVDVSFTPSKIASIRFRAARANTKATAVVVASPRVQCAFSHNEDDA